MWNPSSRMCPGPDHLCLRHAIAVISIQHVYCCNFVKTTFLVADSVSLQVLSHVLETAQMCILYLIHHLPPAPHHTDVCPRPFVSLPPSPARFFPAAFVHASLILESFVTKVPNSQPFFCPITSWHLMNMPIILLSFILLECVHLRHGGVFVSFTNVLFGASP